MLLRSGWTWLVVAGVALWILLIWAQSRESDIWGPEPPDPGAAAAAELVRMIIYFLWVTGIVVGIVLLGWRWHRTR